MPSPGGAPHPVHGGPPGGLSPAALRAAYNTRHAAGLIRGPRRFYEWIAGLALDRLAPARRGLARALDVGCGAGDLLAALTARGAALLRELHGLELSDVALAAARQAAPAARHVLAQAERLPYPDAAFDLVACLGNLEHFIDPASGAREMARVLRRDGRGWILLPNSYYSGDLWRVLRTGYGPDHHQPLQRFATLNEWRDFLEANGLEVLGVTPYNKGKWWKRLLPRSLAYHFLYEVRSAAGERA